MPGSPSSATPSDAPDLALTALALPEDRAKALTAGYRLHLAKPVDPDVLVGAVSQLVAR
jgi:CheY-like chemotaxis protein